MVEEDPNVEWDSPLKRSPRKAFCLENLETERKKKILGDLDKVKERTIKRIDAAELAAQSARNSDKHFLIKKFETRYRKTSSKESRGNSTTRIQNTEFCGSNKNLISQDMNQFKLDAHLYKIEPSSDSAQKRIKTTASKVILHKRTNTGGELKTPSFHSLSTKYYKI